MENFGSRFEITQKTYLVLRSDESECQGQESKVNVTRDKKRAVHSQHPRGMGGMERSCCK